LSGLDNLKWEKHNTTNIISDKEIEKSKYSDLKAAKQAEFITAQCSHVYKLKYGEMTKVLKITFLICLLNLMFFILNYYRLHEDE
jgi:hypothetical protein